MTCLDEPARVDHTSQRRRRIGGGGGGGGGKKKKKKKEKKRGPFESGLEPAISKPRVQCRLQPLPHCQPNDSIVYLYSYPR